MSKIAKINKEKKQLSDTIKKDKASLSFAIKEQSSFNETIAKQDQSLKKLYQDFNKSEVLVYKLLSQVLPDNSNKSAIDSLIKSENLAQEKLSNNIEKIKEIKRIIQDKIYKSVETQNDISLSINHLTVAQDTLTTDYLNAAKNEKDGKTKEGIGGLKAKSESAKGLKASHGNFIKRGLKKAKAGAISKVLGKIPVLKNTTWARGFTKEKLEILTAELENAETQGLDDVVKKLTKKVNALKSETIKRNKQASTGILAKLKTKVNKIPLVSDKYQHYMDAVKGGTAKQRAKVDNLYLRYNNMLKEKTKNPSAKLIILIEKIKSKLKTAMKLYMDAANKYSTGFKDLNPYTDLELFAKDFDYQGFEVINASEAATSKVDKKKTGTITTKVKEVGGIASKVGNQLGLKGSTETKDIKKDDVSSIKKFMGTISSKVTDIAFAMKKKQDTSITRSKKTTKVKSRKGRKGKDKLPNAGGGLLGNITDGALWAKQFFKDKKQTAVNKVQTVTIKTLSAKVKFNRSLALRNAKTIKVMQATCCAGGRKKKNKKGGKSVTQKSSKVNKSKVGSKGLGKGLGKGMAKLIPGVGLALAAGMAIYDGVQGYKNAGENLGIQDKDLTTGNKMASAGGSIVSGITMGLVDGKDASKGINNLFGGNKAIEKYEKLGLIDHDTIGNSELVDRAGISNLKPKEIMEIIKIDDWSKEDLAWLNLTYKNSMQKKVKPKPAKVVDKKKKRTPSLEIKHSGPVVPTIKNKKVTKPTKNKKVTKPTKNKKVVVKSVPKKPSMKPIYKSVAAGYALLEFVLRTKDDVKEYERISKIAFMEDPNDPFKDFTEEYAKTLTDFANKLNLRDLKSGNKKVPVKVANKVANKVKKTPQKGQSELSIKKDKSKKLKADKLNKKTMNTATHEGVTVKLKEPEDRSEWASLQKDTSTEADEKKEDFIQELQREEKLVAKANKNKVTKKASKVASKKSADAKALKEVEGKKTATAKTFINLKKEVTSLQKEINTIIGDGITSTELDKIKADYASLLKKAKSTYGKEGEAEVVKTLSKKVISLKVDKKLEAVQSAQQTLATQQKKVREKAITNNKTSKQELKKVAKQVSVVDVIKPQDRKIALNDGVDKVAEQFEDNIRPYYDKDESKQMMQEVINLIAKSAESNNKVIQQVSKNNTPPKVKISY